MFLLNWLRVRRPHTLRRNPKQVRRSVRLGLEYLEDRLVPATTLFAPDVTSLQNDIQTANTNFSQQYIIQLTSTNPYNLTGQQTITDASGLIIEGLGAASAAVINAAPNSRVFEVESDASVTFAKLTIQGGVATDDGSGSGSAPAKGGGLLNLGGTVTLSNVAVQGNKALGNPGENALGGGVYSSNGSLTLTNSTISGNVAQGGIGFDGGTPTAGAGTNGGTGGAGAGGGVADNGGTITILNSSITGNSGIGGIGGKGGTGAAGSSASYGGHAGYTGGTGGVGGAGAGGGLYNSGGVVQMINSTVATNTTVGGDGGNGGNGGAGTDSTPQGVGGAAGMGGDGEGGGVYESTEGTASTYVNDTVAFNRTTAGANGAAGTGTSATPSAVLASTFGGGLFVSGTAPLLTNTLLESNQAANGPDYDGPADASDSNNFVSDPTNPDGTFPTTNNNLFGLTPQLGSATVAPNGTTYYPLLPNSVAINAGTDNALPTIEAAEGGVSQNQTTDQIANPRHVGPAIDIGAVEYQGQPTTTTVQNVQVSFKPTDQTVTLSATVTVTSSGNPVTEGTVTFKVFDSNGNQLNSSVTVPESAGQFSTPFTLPANTPPGLYTIQAVYDDSSTGTFETSTGTGTLTITSAPTAVMVSNVQATFSPQDQPVSLQASVTSNGVAVNEGTVVFTVTNSSGTTVGSPVTVNVSNGQASTPFTVPGGLPAGTYTITANYTDSSGDFQNGTGTGTLTITSASTVVTVSNVQATFSPQDQPVSLQASVTSNGVAINEGTVVFTVTDSSGTQVGSPVTANVSNGQASASFTVPGGLAAGIYTITAKYTDSSGDFQNGSGTGTLTITSASSAVTVSNVQGTFSPQDQSVTFSATVTSGESPVNQGTVVFTLTNSSGTQVGQPVTANVSNGQASTSFTLPANTPLGTYTITANYSDSSGDFQNGTGTGTLTITSAPTTASVSDVTASFSPATQTINVSAKVMSGEVPVNEGQVQFVVTNASGQTVGGPVTANVNNGQASTSIDVPGGLPPGSYTITATYRDPSGNFQGSTGTGRLTIAPAGAPTVSVSNASAPFTNEDPVITLQAFITSPRTVINEGQVQFTIVGLTQQPIVAQVVNGQAVATFGVPPNTPLGSYTIVASYSASSGDFQSATGTGTLTIVPSPTTVTINNVSIVYGLLSEMETLTAVVRNVLGVVVDHGTVTFTDRGQTMTAPIVNGLATVTFNIPLMAENPFSHSIALKFGDSAGNFLASNGLFQIEQTILEFWLQMLALSSLMQANAGNS